MFSAESEMSFLTREEAENIQDQSERDFALRCLAVGCILIHQVPVGYSTIDFLVINPKRHKVHPESCGTLVEVTFMKKEEKDKRVVKKRQRGREKKVQNATGRRKDRQIESMALSGYRWTILYRENLRRMLVGV